MVTVETALMLAHLHRERRAQATTTEKETP